LNWPSAIPVQFDRRIVTFHCRISEIPGTAVNPVIVKYAGREIKYAGQRIFNNLTVTILNDEGFTVRKGLELWFEFLNTRESNIALLTAPTGDPGRGYSARGTVRQFAKTGAEARSYVFVDMFPVNLAPIPLDWSNDAVIEEYTCEFAYQYWVPGDSAGAIQTTLAGVLGQA
jgi:hypothetical protein